MKLESEIRENIPSTSSGQLPWDQFQYSILNALIYCSDDYDYRRCLESNHTAHRRRLPNFGGESLNYKNILNYILVTWQQSLKTMVLTPTDFFHSEDTLKKAVGL